MGFWDASTDTSSRQDHTLALVKLSAKSVEQKVFLENFKHTNIYSFHPRSEYLHTNSIGLIAINEDGQIEGVNSNTRIMLSGLYKDDSRDFYNIFNPLRLKILRHDMNANKTVQVKDWLGSTVFMKLFQKQVTSTPHNELKNTTPTYTPCSECYDSTLKEQKCLLIQKTYDQLDGKITAVSKTLNISRTTVYKHIQNK